MGRLLSQVKYKELYTVFSRDSQMKEIKNNNQYFFNMALSITHKIDFKSNPDYKLGNNEWFFVDYSTCDKSIINYIKSTYFDTFKSTSKISNLTKDNLSKLYFLIYGVHSSSTWKLNFQVLPKTSLIKERDFLDLSSPKIKYEHYTNVLDFKNFIDLHIDEKDKMIYFKKFTHLKAIHKDFIDLYKAASAKEVKDFIDNVNKSTLFSITYTDSPQEQNLKRIKYILDNKKLTILSKVPEIKTYISKYSIDLIEVGSKYQVTSNKELTEFIKIVDENYYESEITKEKRETNSTKKI